MANNYQLTLIQQGVEVWNEWRNEHSDVNMDLSGANLSGNNFDNADLHKANLSKANLHGASFKKTNLRNANLSGADLQETDLSTTDIQGAIYIRTNLSFANLSGLDLHDANLTGAKLNGVNLISANLSGAVISGADLENANLDQANLTFAILTETNLKNSIITNCKIYGISAWGVKGSPSDQSNLIITRNGEPEITVDDLQVAQFIYLLLNNKTIRNVFDSITSKAVLILGRFSPQRKIILDLIREELRKYNYVPILFDFENTENQTLLETIMTLAGMSQFIIADLTEATMVREELRSIVEKYPSKPIQPILYLSNEPYVTFPEIYSGFKNVLEVYQYKDQHQVTDELKMKIIEPVEKWLKAKKSNTFFDNRSQREKELEQQIKLLTEKIRKYENS
jgi:uncharacterized protein YjbI with pentapeptide repeats